MNSSNTNKFKVGDKIRRVYVGYYDMPVGSEWIVEKVVNNKEIKLKGSDEVEWLSENFELVSSSTQDIDCNFKVGDLVEFMEYTDESEWESQYGLNVGDMVKVVSVERDSFTVRSKTGCLVWTDPSQVVKCCKDNLEKSEDTSHTNKFKVGDKVKVISLDNTDDNLGLTKDTYSVGDESVVETVETCDTVTLRDEYLYHVSDLELVDYASETSQFQGELGVANKDTNTTQNELIGSLSKLDVLLPKNDEDDFTCCLGKGIESDGGSSSYYFTKLPKYLIDQIVVTGGIEIKDIIRYVFDNNADAFNIIKAQKRIIEHGKGKGKAGITGLYDAKKITFFANEQYEAMKNKEG